MTSHGHLYYRLHPEAAYLRDVGYVFIDLHGRTVRMEEGEFNALQSQCANGIEQPPQLCQGGMLIPCATATESTDSFLHQELIPDDLAHA